VCGGLKGVAKKIECNIRVEGGGAGGAMETLVWQPVPAGAVIGEGEVWCPPRRIAQFTREAGCVCREIGERDGLNSFGHNGVRGSKSLERIAKVYGLVRDEFGEDVGGKDLC
jgi:hypothetical protein